MNTVDGLEALKRAIISLKATKRALFTNYIELTSNVKIGVKGYKIYSKTTPIKTTQACRVGNQYDFIDKKTIHVGVVSLLCTICLYRDINLELGHW